jgi:transcriptional regulator GlxA family with amidase domain
MNTTATTSSPIKLQIVIYNGFEIIDGLAPFDVFSIARHVGALFETTLVTLDGTTEVVTLNGGSVKPTGHFNPSADLLLIPVVDSSGKRSTPRG